MRYDKRNRLTLDELAPATNQAALNWYEYCVQHGIELLVTDARRTEAEQRANVARGASKTMKSYHLVGQAFDFVPLDKTGRALWVREAYFKEPILSAVRYAKLIGFNWGGDWPGSWDCPHMEFHYKGYGTDTDPPSAHERYLLGKMKEAKATKNIGLEKWVNAELAKLKGGKAQ